MTAPGSLVLPGTDLLVSRLCLGGNRLGAQLDRDASFALLDAFVVQGGRFIDTAHVYADWLPDTERSCSEKTLGRWLAQRGAGAAVVIATKGGHPRLDRPGVGRLDRASLRQDVEESLTYLGLPALDLFYLHRDDPARPAQDILGVLDELRSDGLIRHYAASNWSASRLTDAADAAARHGWQGFVANQPGWSLAVRNPGTASADLLAMDGPMYAWHKRTGIAAIPYSSQAQGYFDKVAADDLDGATARIYDSPANRASAARLADLARRHGATPTQVALHALTRAPFPTIPVIGCRTPDQIASSFKSLSLELPATETELLLSHMGRPPVVPSP